MSSRFNSLSRSTDTLPSIKKLSPLRLASCKIISNNPSPTPTKIIGSMVKSESVNISQISSARTPVENKVTLDSISYLPLKFQYKGYGKSLTPVRVRVESRRKLRPATPYMIFEDQEMPADLALMNNLRKSLIHHLEKDITTQLDSDALYEIRRGYDVSNSQALSDISNLYIRTSGTDAQEQTRASFPQSTS